MPTSVVAAVVGSLVSDYVVGVAVLEWGLGSLAASALGAVAGGLTSVAVNAAFSDSPGATSGDQQFSQELRDNLVTVRQPITHWQYIYGRTRVAGVMTFGHQSADGKLHLVLTFAGHVSQEIEAIQFNDEVIPLDGNGLATGKYAGYVRIKKSLGDEAGQPFPDLVTESEGKWTDAHRQSGRTKIYVRLVFNVDLFPTGLPNITAVIKGRKVYDPRTGLTAWSDNPSLCIADFLCDAPAGLACVYADEIDETQLIAAANIDDEAVTLAAGGTESRYTLNGTATVNVEPRATLGRMLTANAGKARYIGGVWRIHPAAYVTPTITLTEDTLRAVPHISPRLSASDLSNRVKGLYISEDNLWQPSDFPPITNATYLAEDNNEASWRELDLPFTKSPATAQRIAKIELEKMRQQITVEWPGKFTCYRLQAGDTVKITFGLLGWSEKVFEVEQSGLAIESDDGRRLGADMVLRETASSVFSWSSGEETAVDPAPDTNLPDPFVVAAPESLALSSGTGELLLHGDGTVESRIKVVWPASTDAFVLSSELQYKQSASSDWIAGPIPSSDATVSYIGGVVDGVAYDVRIRAINSLGVRSAWTQASPHIVIGKTALPPAVTRFSVVEQPAGGRQFFWEMDNPPVDLMSWLVRWSPGTVHRSWEQMAAMFSAGRDARQWTTQDPVGDGEYVFAIKAVDTTGNQSITALYVDALFDAGSLGTLAASEFSHQADWPGTLTACIVDAGALIGLGTLTWNSLSATAWNDAAIVPWSNTDGTIIYETEVLDAGAVASHAYRVGSVEAGATTYQVRSSDDNVTWSAYAATSTTPITARYFQFKFSTTGPAAVLYRAQSLVYA